MLPFGFFIVCGALWVAGFPWITRDEEGTAANVQWLISMIVALMGIVALVVGLRSLVVSRRRPRAT